MTEEALQDKIIVRLFTSLKTPDVIKELQEFTGDVQELHQFIQNVDEIIALCRQILPDDEPTPTVFIKAIRNKIRGEANRVLINEDVGNNWDDIKQILINHYSDSRSEVALIRDLHALRQGYMTSKEFYNKILEIQTALSAHARLRKCDTKIKITLYREMCLAQFLANLREPLGSNIRARDPQTLTEELEVCQTEENMYYIKIKPPIRQPNQQNFKRQIRFNNTPKLEPEIGQEYKNLKLEPRSVSSYLQNRSFNQNHKTGTIPKQTSRFPAVKAEKNINNTETNDVYEPEIDDEVAEDCEENNNNAEFFIESASDSE